MSQGFNILRSTDGGAPTLNGTAGSLISVLDALLEISGSDPFWAKAFTGTNKAVYRSDNGERYYFRVDDSIGAYAGVRGFATMSDVDTGTDQFPTGTQQTTYVWHKSSTADSTSRTYLGICTDRFIILLVSGGWSGAGQDLYFFGEPIKFNPADTGATCLRGSNQTTLTNAATRQGVTSSSPWNIAAGFAAPANNANTMMPMAQNHNNSSASASGVYMTGVTSSGSVPFSSYAFAVPAPVVVGSSVSSGIGIPRGKCPHVYQIAFGENDANLAAADVFQDADGRAYEICAPSGTATLAAGSPLFAIMTSDTEVGTP